MSTNPEEVDWDWVYKRNKRIWLGLDENDNPIDEKDTETTSKEESPYGDAGCLKDLPFLPKTLMVPKQCIQECCVFKCPVTGELFGCGQFGEDESTYAVVEECVNSGDRDEEDKKVKIVLHRSKKGAVHAAAARALDCLSFREGQGSKSYGLCKEAPYMEDDDENKFVVPSSMPSEFFDWLESNLNQSEAKPIEMDVDKE